MRLKILHEIEYRYSEPVRLEPHIFYLKPRENRGQKLLSFDLSIAPAPKLRAEVIDPLGNDSIHAWFEGTTNSLTIRCASDVDVCRSNPFDYLMHPDFCRLPAHYAPEVRQSLLAYSHFLPDPNMDPAVLELSDAIAARADRSISLFLSELCRTIAKSFAQIHRPHGSPWPAARVLAEKQGACRDLAMLFIECCRAQGLVTRFTSGYYEGDGGRSQNELHAWAEVFVDGGGWRGFDPTAGLAVSESHVTIAAAHLSEAVSPVIGSFRGKARSVLTTRVQVRRS